jgi:phage-related protein
MNRTLRNLLIILCYGCVPFAAPKAQAYDLVYDPINWIQNLLKEIEETYQTSIQNGISATASTISSINSTISQVTQFIYKIESLVQQAVGTVTSKTQLLEQLYGEVTNLPASFQAAYQNILNIPNQFQSVINGSGNWGVAAEFGGNTWGTSNDPITRYLGSAVAALENLTGLINQAGYQASAIGRFPAYNGPAFAANFRQARRPDTEDSRVRSKNDHCPATTSQKRVNAASRTSRRKPSQDTGGRRPNARQPTRCCPSTCRRTTSNKRNPALQHQCERRGDIRRGKVL